MKTNFTMTKRLLFAFAALAFVASSCSDDDPIDVPAPDVAGVYTFTSATLIDGNIGDASTTNMVIEHGGGPGVNVDVPAGNVQETTFFANAVLSGVAPCTDPAIPVTYKVDLQADGTIAFICTSEGDLSEDAGIWELADENKTLVLTIESAVLGQVVVEIENLMVVSPVLSGTINSFPMIKSAAAGIGPTNLQFISFDVVLTK